MCFNHFDYCVVSVLLQKQRIVIPSEAPETFALIPGKVHVCKRGRPLTKKAFQFLVKIWYKHSNHYRYLEYVL